LNYQAGKWTSKQVNIQTKQSGAGDKINEQSFITKVPVELRNDSA